MDKFGSDFWNDRYNKKDYLYGLQPNVFFKSQIVKYKPGNLFMPGDGEGRNSVYAASLGWKVDAVDFSSAAIEKARKLSGSFNLQINYEIEDLNEYFPKKNFYDAASLIFVHLPPVVRKNLHAKLIDCLKLKGVIIIEVYEKKQIGKNSGGPQSAEMLYSIDELQNDFSNLQILYLKEELIDLNESEKHSGEANVIRFVGMKT